VSMLVCLFLCIEILTNCFVSEVVFLLSYLFGDVVNSASLCPRRNYVAIGPIIPW